jgi:hypothetical protein
MSIAEADGLTLAGVNGTILAIVVAGLTGFFFLAFQTLDRMETELVEEANRVNRHRFIQLGGDSPPFSTKGLRIDRLLSLFGALVHGDAREREEESGPLLPHVDLPPQENLVARGSALVSVIAAVGYCYPFVAEDGSVEPLRLNDVPSVLDWLPDFEVALWSLSAPLRDTRDYVAQLAAAADDASAELKQKYLEGVRAYRSRNGLPALEPSNELLRSHTLSLGRFLDFVEASSEIARTTRARFETLARYRRRLPSRTLVLATTFGVLVAFTCGVAIPMIHPTINSAVDAWVPVALYALSLGFGAIRITRRYQQQGTGKAESQWLRP